MRSDKLVVTASKLLIVEGPDDEYFFKALIAKAGLADIQIAATQGRARFNDVLVAMMNQDTFTRVTHLGIVQDADENSGARFASVRDTLRRRGLDPPDQPFAKSATVPVTSIAVIPDGTSPGTLEDLCLSLVDQPQLDCIDAFLACVVEAHPFRPNHKNRALAFLASCDDPTNSIGMAALRGHLDLQHTNLERLQAWLLDVFRT